MCASPEESSVEAGFHVGWAGSRNQPYMPRSTRPAMMRLALRDTDFGSGSTVRHQDSAGTGLAGRGTAAAGPPAAGAVPADAAGTPGAIAITVARAAATAILVRMAGMLTRCRATSGVPQPDIP